MKLLSLDLEMNQPSGTIIQVGAAVGSMVDGSIIDRRSWIIHTGEILPDFIIELTGITQDRVDDSPHSLRDAYEGLKAMRIAHECHVNLLTWGGGDTVTLQDQLHQPKDWPFGRRWIDTKTVYQALKMAAGEPHIRGGLARAMTRVGLNFQGRKHDAGDDAANTFRMWYQLVSMMPKTMR